MAHSHHEWVDGSGYPRKLTGSQISPFAKITAIIDAYDDIIAEHVYRGERTAFEALKEINAGRGKQFDESLVKHFIDMIGVFPVGSIVELSSGEVGIVLAQTLGSPMLPRVVLLLDHNKQLISRMTASEATMPKRPNSPAPADFSVGARWPRTSFAWLVSPSTADFTAGCSRYWRAIAIHSGKCVSPQVSVRCQRSGR